MLGSQLVHVIVRETNVLTCTFLAIYVQISYYQE